MGTGLGKCKRREAGFFTSFADELNSRLPRRGGGPETSHMETRPDSENPKPQGWRLLLAMPEIPRVLPFVLFLVLGSLQGKLFPGSEYWLYAVKTVLVGWMLWALRGLLAEVKWTFSWEGLAVGVVIAALWIGLSGHVPTLGDIWDAGHKLITGKAPEPAKPEAPWNPVAFFGGNAALGWAFVLVRVLGRSLVVPPMEEVFYRSFFYRYIVSPKFNEVAFGQWHSVAFVVTSVIFGLAHPDDWLPGILCGAAYQWLVLRKQRLGDAMLAHATTNLLISIYAIATNQWRFT
jgi:CAAX prenyl protease-like protein